MDIQKEREAFEQHLTDAGLVEFSDYGFAVDECDEYLHEPTQVAWDSWLIGLNRAKAQAVPDGFVVVSQKDLLELTIAINAVDLATHTESKTNEVRGMWQQVALKLMALGISQEPAND